MIFFRKLFLKNFRSGEGIGFTKHMTYLRVKKLPLSTQSQKYTQTTNPI